MKRLAFVLVALLVAASATAENRQSLLSIALGDARYLKLTGGTVGGNLTVTGNFLVSGTCTGCGLGDVVGPASSTNNAIVRFDLATGKLVKNSLVTIDNSGSIHVPAAQGVSFTASGLNTIGWANTVGPTWKDDGTLFTLTHDVQALSADRTVIWQNLAGTVALSANNLSFFSSTTSAQLRTLLSDETGTGFAVFNNAPALLAPTTDTLQTSGNVGLGTTPSASSGVFILGLAPSNTQAFGTMSSNDAAGTSASAAWRAQADTAVLTMFAHGLARTTSRFGITIGAWSELQSSAGNGLIIGTTNVAPVRIGANSIAGEVFDGTTALPSLPLAALTAGTMTVTNSAVSAATVTRYDWTNAMVTALGATTAGDVAVATLPAKTIVRNAYVVIKTSAGTVTTLSVAVGRTSAAYIDYIVASDAKAGANTVYGDASGERGTNLTIYDMPSYTGTTVVNAHFISTGGNLSTVTTSTGTVYLITEVLP